MIIIVLGLPGSGKSYFAKRLAKKIQASYVNSDVIRNKLFAVKTYSTEEKKQVYKAMITEMTKAIQQKENIVLDATFYKKSYRNVFSKTAKEFGENMLFMEVWADEKTIKERLSKKRQDSDADFPVFLHLKEVFEPLKRAHLKLESTQENIEKMLSMALYYIQKDHG